MTKGKAANQRPLIVVTAFGVPGFVLLLDRQQYLYSPWDILRDALFGDSLLHTGSA
jgi:hypothetical protein